MTLFSSLWRALGRIRVRLLVVNLVVVLVPVAGLEFARIYERQLLDGLQRDVENQAILVSRWMESELARGVALGAPHQAAILEQAAKGTRTRIRLIDAEHGVLADSHQHGPPEGPEFPPPSLMRTAREFSEDHRGSARSWSSEPTGHQEDLRLREEVIQAFAGHRGAFTRVSRNPSAVYLFIAHPIVQGGQVKGVVYLVRSTNPVLQELHRIRSGLIEVMAAALGITAFLTLGLAWTISRPLSRLAKAAQRIAAGERNVALPRGGGGEISELGEAFEVMTAKLDARSRYLSEFAADVAHEFKSPLTSIRGAAELLEEGAADDPEARSRFLHNIELDAGRLDQLVSRLLELSRIEASQVAPVPVNLQALVTRAVARSQTPESSVVLEYQSRRTTILARETELETALLNLLDNALRFSPEGGIVMVRVVDGADRRLGIVVRDQGPGIDPVNLPRVFDRFFTTDAEGEGTGLGLAIVKTVAVAHGGEIVVESPPGEGATFTLWIAPGYE